MAKYNYDKSVLKGLGVGPFLGEVKEREAHIAAAPAEEIKSVFNANIIAGKLHPHFQNVVVAEIVDYPNAKMYKLVPNESKGTKELAYFRAGQYLSVVVPMGNEFVTKPYTICSAPKAALGDKDNYYCICIKKNAKGYASEYILNNWKVGEEITVSGPLGYFYYQALRDAKNVVAASGGSGITPFVSLAAAVADGIEDINLTILCGNKKAGEILFAKELDEIAARSNGKVKIVHVLSDEKKRGYENGFINAELIKKYGETMGADYSLFVCGPKPMYKFVCGEVAKLGLPIRRARFEVGGEYGDPSANAAFTGDVSAEYKVSVIARGETYDITCKGNQTLMDAVQKAGIKISSDCRSGSCGWCHSRLVYGEVFVPEDADGRRMADTKFGWIHPCVTYPLTDVQIEVFPIA